MEGKLTLEPVAYYRGSFGSKFGIPRQSSLAESLSGKIVFTDKYKVQEALRGLEGFSHIWLIWGFSANKEAKGEWQPTAAPWRKHRCWRLGYKVPLQAQSHRPFMRGNRENLRQ